MVVLRAAKSGDDIIKARALFDVAGGRRARSGAAGPAQNVNFPSAKAALKGFIAPNGLSSGPA